MDYFDKQQVLRNDSYNSGVNSNSNKSNKVIVGGGGTISRPPKANNRQLSQNLDY